MQQAARRRTAPETPSRRDRVRAATTVEIKQTARRLLVEQGPEAVSLRAIGREMGMTAPALYRYFGSHEDLLMHVCGDIFTELAGEIENAIDAAGQARRGHDRQAGRRVPGVPHWALTHRPEFALLFGTPLPGMDVETTTSSTSARRVRGEFLALFQELWHRHPFPVPADDEIEPGLVGSSPATGTGSASTCRSARS